MANNIEWARPWPAVPVPTHELSDLTDAYEPGEVGMAFGDGVMIYAPSWAKLADGLEAAARLARAAVQAPHDCGLCDGPLSFDGIEDGHRTWECTRCGWLHTSRDCCDPNPELDTWSSASRQHYIDTGEYLPADRKGQDQ